MARNTSGKKVRYAVVGLGHFAQSAILPAFAHAPNSELVALVSGDAAKRAKLTKAYQVPFALGYHDYDSFLSTGAVDAVYIALPNHLHADYTIRAAKHGVHVLCEKPLAVTVAECRQMIAACKKADVKLMTAYRLHFEPANLTSAKVVHDERIGEPKLFSSTFAMDLREGNVRGKPLPGAGPLYDIGTYCINAARGMFRAEPEEVFAMPGDGTDQTACVLRFPKGRLATFAVTFEGYHGSRYEVVGTKGSVEANPAYQHRGALKNVVKIGEREKKQTFAARDQVAAELIEFSTCVLDDREPEPSGREGLLDVRVIEALETSAKKHRPVRLTRARKRRRPTLRQVRRAGPPPKKARPLVKVASPGKH
ncbi:MAG: Gfo/Idh/MocA family oxidoreductase [Myxococcaceae bacterium]|nr:Gfo/Idh/MocA family oxidoreductase [Myxococcaceae bacterium]